VRAKKRFIASHFKLLHFPKHHPHPLLHCDKNVTKNFYFLYKFKIGVDSVIEEQNILRLQSLYRSKKTFMEKIMEPVTSYEFYRNIFPAGSFERKGHYEDSKANGIALEFMSNGKIRKYIVTDELDVLQQLQASDFAIISPISYIGCRRCTDNARYLYALAFDLDGVGMPQLKNLINQMANNILPPATYIVNSGRGVHLYYLLTEPVPMYPRNQQILKIIKRALTNKIWNKSTSTIKVPEQQGILQGFRIVGSASKLGPDYPVRAYRYGEPVSLDSLVRYVPVQAMALQKLVLKVHATKREMHPDNRQIIKKCKKRKWIVNRSLYDWWLKRIRTEIKVGHRYFAIMCLAICAIKCNIKGYELRRDAYALLSDYDSMSIDPVNRFTAGDIERALEAYDEKYVTFTRAAMEKLSGLPITANKRNGRTQKEHLALARAKQNQSDPNGNWRNKKGRPTKCAIVKDWRQKHPNGSKADCCKDTGLDRKTVSKWW